jgi:putative ABC transport system substrate-binding protein
VRPLSRRALLACLAGVGASLGGMAVASACLPLSGQTSPKLTARIGYLFAGDEPGHKRALDAFRDGLRELGWLESDNLTLIVKYADNMDDHVVALAEELAGAKLDLLVGAGITASERLAAATPSTPVVVLYVSDPVANGLVASLARPGGNVTGTASGVARDLSTKQIELLAQLAGGLSRLGYVTNLSSRSAVNFAMTVETTARAVGADLRVVDVRREEEIEPAFAALAVWQPSAVFVQNLVPLTSAMQQTAEAAAQHRLLTGYTARAFVEAGGLVAYGADARAAYRRGAYYVDRILHGAKPGDLPVEQPTAYELVINRTAAEQLGLSIPPEVAAQVTEWVQ